MEIDFLKENLFLLCVIQSLKNQCFYSIIYNSNIRSSYFSSSYFSSPSLSFYNISIIKWIDNQPRKLTHVNTCSVRYAKFFYIGSSKKFGLILKMIHTQKIRNKILEFTERFYRWKNMRTGWLNSPTIYRWKILMS